MDSSVRLWDLTTGESTGYLKGHEGIVKVLQVEENGVCVTGGKDGRIKVWDLEKAQEEFVSNGRSESLEREREEDVFGSIKPVGVNGTMFEDGLLREEGGASSSIRQEPQQMEEQEKGACMRTMEGHTKAVTTLYFDGPTLVSFDPLIAFEQLTHVFRSGCSSLDHLIRLSVNGISILVNAS